MTKKSLNTIPKGLYPKGIAKAEDKQAQNASPAELKRIHEEDTKRAKAARKGLN
jgi:hypothetical protein